jgi:hypothetical protein
MNDDISDVLKSLLEHTESLDLKENVYLNTVNLLKKCFEENEKQKKIKPPVVKECNIKIKLQNCLDSKECLIQLTKLERVYTSENGCHYYNINYSINNCETKILKINHIEGFEMFSEKFCRIYKPKVIRFEYTDNIKMTYRLDETLKHILDEHVYSEKYKNFEYNAEDEERSEICFNHYDFYREVFQWIYYSICVNGLDF